MEYYSSVKDEILHMQQHGGTHNTLDGVMLSEISQTEKDKYVPHYFTHMWNFKS